MPVRLSSVQDGPRCRGSRADAGQSGGRAAEGDGIARRACGATESSPRRIPTAGSRRPERVRVGEGRRAGAINAEQGAGGEMPGPSHVRSGRATLPWVAG